MILERYRGGWVGSVFASPCSHPELGVVLFEEMERGLRPRPPWRLLSYNFPLRHKNGAPSFSRPLFMPVSPQMEGHISLSLLGGSCIVPGDGIKRDPDMDYIGCLGSNGQHSQILPFRVTFIVVTRYINFRPVPMSFREVL